MLRFFHTPINTALHGAIQLLRLPPPDVTGIYLYANELLRRTTDGNT